MKGTLQIYHRWGFKKDGPATLTGKLVYENGRAVMLDEDGYEINDLDSAVIYAVDAEGIRIMGVEGVTVEQRAYQEWLFVPEGLRQGEE